MLPSTVRFHCVTIFLCSGLMTGVGVAYPEWSLRSVSGPSPRYGLAMVYDSCREETISFGGQNSSQTLGETWSWNGSSWSLRSTIGPTPRGAPAMAFDSARCVVVLFGGADNFGNYLGDTWEWDGNTNTWELQTPVASPPTRAGASMAYDPVRQKMVMWGGWNGGRDVLTWEYDGSNWLSFSPANHPVGRDKHVMVYDAQLDMLVLFGGKVNTGGHGGDQNDTWLYDLTTHTWTQHLTTDQPSPRANQAMVYDSARQVVVLFGGFGPLNDTVVLGDTWEWAGGDWNQVPTPTHPSPRWLSGFSYDAKNAEMLVFGGHETYPQSEDFAGDTWTYGELDTDNDGVSDSEDNCPETDPDTTVVVNGCETEVGNVVFEDGCSMLDMIQACEADAANHGALVRCVANLAVGWLQEGLITGAERGRIMRCVARSKHGYKPKSARSAPMLEIEQ